MKVLLISDVHANYEAICSIQKQFLKDEIDEIWFLGDVPDRGPDPTSTLQWLNDHVRQENWLLGNHDTYLLNLASKGELIGVNPMVLKTSTRQRGELFLSNVSLEPLKQANKNVIVKGNGETAYFLTHGSLSDPMGHNRSIYSWTTPDLLNDEFKVLKKLLGPSHRQAVCFVGHTHIPTLIGLENGSQQVHYEPIQIEYGKPYDLKSKDHWFINPGSVGSPRDFDFRAACAVFDTVKNEIIFHRVKYEVEVTALKLLNRGYDTIWADRLFDAEPPQETPDSWIAYFQNNRL